MRSVDGHCGACTLYNDTKVVFIDVNSLTAIRFWREPKTMPSYFSSRYVSCRVDFYVGIRTKTQNTTKNTHPHHGELPPPPAARILQLDRIRRKPDEDEGFGEGAVEAI